MKSAFLTSVELTVRLSPSDTYGDPDDALPLTFYNSTIIWLFATAAVDVAISAGLAVQVRRRLSGAGVAGFAFKSLITTALQTAAYTALFAIGGGELSLFIHWGSMHLLKLHASVVARERRPFLERRADRLYSAAIAVIVALVDGNTAKTVDMCWAFWVGPSLSIAISA